MVCVYVALVQVAEVPSAAENSEYKVYCHSRSPFLSRQSTTLLPVFTNDVELLEVSDNEDAFYDMSDRISRMLRIGFSSNSPNFL